ncbi:MAG: MerR family DNA-binding transcriptional regulator, partial [Oligoflexus sp.]|nr:MerR family DNA-binding transcriptional regulator [Oligoflexus sp.]
MYISVGAAAEILGVSISTLRRWEKEKVLLPSYRTIGGHRR